MTEKVHRASHLGTTPLEDQKQTVMIIEDQKLVAWDIEQTLRDNGHSEFVFATSIRETRAALALRGGQIALAILDVKLEDGDGTLLIEELAGHDIPVLVITGYSGFVHMQVPVLYKPFSDSALLMAVASFLHSDN
jgi:DNA-binding NtrC family response regulator